MVLALQHKLLSIGAALDGHQLLRVLNGGFVVLDKHAVPLTASTEQPNGREKQRGSAAGSRPGTARWQGPTRRPQSTSATTPVVSADPEACYEAELGGLGEQYPGAQ